MYSGRSGAYPVCQNNPSVSGSDSTALAVSIKAAGGRSFDLAADFPQVKGEATTTPKLAVYGKNFAENAKVRFNMQAVPKDMPKAPKFDVPWPKGVDPQKDQAGVARTERSRG